MHIALTSIPWFKLWQDSYVYATPQCLKGSSKARSRRITAWALLYIIIGQGLNNGGPLRLEYGLNRTQFTSTALQQNPPTPGTWVSSRGQFRVWIRHKGRPQELRIRPGRVAFHSPNNINQQCVTDLESLVFRSTGWTLPGVHGFQFPWLIPVNFHLPGSFP